ncbi:nucleotidyltransferase family protein [Natronorubrum thiooxidans]|uniref:Molybdenum cofactor cytidylyltransferase n=1 Tax=Natronorubrum thiooxidans TaxID=308853 RepID=A0A1N7H0U6_9EURY|nr:nucleotidyltransferase family protein [Natronorubrum thiooxidans]SIS18464.1 molybdenum cofactor cytidylyltransferase [Natronorubrum thiooxidans]
MTENDADEDAAQSVTADLPLLEADDVSHADDGHNEPAVAGVLLAAGTSSRYGTENKLLATLEGEPIVRHAARPLVRSSVDPVVVVLGHEADRVQDALEGLPVETVINEAYDTGQASSLRAGIEAVYDCDDVDAVLVALGDMPFVTPETIETVVSAYAAGAGEALAAAFDGDRGNPVLFDARFFGALTDVDGDIGGREILLESDSSALIEVDDLGVRRDVDVPDDL